MWMEFQGKKATHDFLSLCNKGSSSFLQHQEPRPPPPPSHGLCLKTHDFLKPSEKEEAEAWPEDRLGQAGPAQVAHVLPGGIGTYSINRLPGNGPPAAATVKHEEVVCVPPRGHTPVRLPVLDSRVGGGNAYGSHAAAGVAFTLWEASAAAKENGTRGFKFKALDYSTPTRGGLVGRS